MKSLFLAAALALALLAHAWAADPYPLPLPRGATPPPIASTCWWPLAGVFYDDWNGTYVENYYVSCPSRRSADTVAILAVGNYGGRLLWRNLTGRIDGNVLLIRVPGQRTSVEFRYDRGYLTGRLYVYDQLRSESPAFRLAIPRALQP